MWQKLYRQPGTAASALPAWMALVLWMAAAASAVVWGLRWLEIGPYRPTRIAALESGTPGTSEVTGGWRVLSPAAGPVSAASPAATSSWKLLGVVASEGGQGSALLAYAGEAPRTWRVGQSLDGQWRLARVAKGRAWLAAASGDASTPALELVLQTSAAQTPYAASNASAAPTPAAAPAPALMPSPPGAPATPARD